MNSLIKNLVCIGFEKQAYNKIFLRCWATYRKQENRLCRKTHSHQSIYLVDEAKNEENIVDSSSVNKYTTRSATCGELTTSHLGQWVDLIGWLEFNRMDKFLVLRDSYGHVQLILRDDAHELRKKIHNLSCESVIQVKGTVVARPIEMINKQQKTGEIEVVVEDLQVVNTATKLPFNIREYQKASELLRMQYRYLSLRFADMQANLRFRSEFCINLREFLARKCGFVEVETPTLFKTTPGGAQEFVVPTRHKQRYYSLVQSPQQFKQMLICGGIDRYFQIARCYRDETSRPDRQPEFTQLDVEMAHTSVAGVMQLVEDALQHAWPAHLPPIARTFARMSLRDAVEKYGSDKPDIRFANHILNLTDLLRPTLDVHSSGDSFFAGCLVFDEGKHALKPLAAHKSLPSKDYPQTRMTHVKAASWDDFRLGFGKLLKDERSIAQLFDVLRLNGAASVVLVHGRRDIALKRLGKIRDLCAAELHQQGVEVYKPGMHFLWIVDFPLFSLDERGKLQAEHHPFTAPYADDLHLLDVDPLKVRAQSFDLVLNGSEVGGGSIRIHNAQLQQKIFEMLSISGLEHIVEMLSCGCPPHGGIALGLDRLVAKVLNTPSIRDVIAFPKTFDGKDPLSGAPSVITDECKRIYHLL